MQRLTKKVWLHGRALAGGGLAAHAVDFVPLACEHFDLALCQRDYFLPGPQALAPRKSPAMTRAKPGTCDGSIERRFFHRRVGLREAPRGFASTHVIIAL
jgi:hypothetical protein